MTSPSEVDYIVVGAGSAGCVLAARLSAQPQIKVLLIEAGGWDSHPLIAVPIGVGWLWKSRRFDWGYFTEPEPNAGNQRVETARGKVVGGSHSINAMAYVRGNPADFDRWAAGGLKGWSYADVLPYFKRSETWSNGGDEFRGGSGPMMVRPTLSMDPVCEATLAAVRTAGHTVTPDYNGATQEGFGVCQWTIARGRRCSTARAYLHPALKRENLLVHVRSSVSRVLLENGRAVGVEYVRNGQTRVCRARREVILSGGTINSPQLLMLSGIGDPAQLREFSIPAQVRLPGVGKNLQDHFSTVVATERPRAGPFVRVTRIDRMAAALANAWMFGRGPGTDLPSGVMGFVKTSPDEPYPDIQYLLWTANPAAHVWFPVLRPAWKDLIAFRPVLLRPESRGEIRLRSADPRDLVRIYKNFLSSPNDLRRLRLGIRMIRDVLRQPAFDGLKGVEVMPGARLQSDAELDEFIRSHPATAHHPVGTCRMGTGADAVVDAELKVHGVAGLRVVDASVMPDLVGGNINAVVIMIAEKAADMIEASRAAPGVH